MGFTFYHNTRCSKSREALALLNEKGIECTIVEYMKSPISNAELEALLDKLGMSAYDLIRKREKIFKAKFVDHDHSSIDWVQAMIDHPELMERPILASDTKAIIGRPPSDILSIIPSNVSNY